MQIGTGILAMALAATSAKFYASFHRPAPVRTQKSSSDASRVLFAAPGRIEGLSDTIELGAAADGILKTIYVRENQRVEKGTLLGEIACDELTAALQASVAEAEAARQARTRLLRGARDEEKKVAGRRTAAARATLMEAKAQLGRQSALYEVGEISRAEYDRANRDFGVAQAEFQTALQSERLLAAPPLPEDRARADAEVMAAEDRVREAQERVNKCAILAPIDGTVLRVFVRPGESFSTVTPRPLFSLADASGRRVKAEIDERDFDKVAVGQSVIVYGEGLSGEKLSGSVLSVSPVMGRKSVFSDDPADKRDRDVLEATITIATDAQWPPIGLRVTVQFLSINRHQ
jgi:multidrug resistance efflux pump